MKTRICNRCGKEVTDNSGLLVPSLPGDAQWFYFYCDDCVLIEVPIVDPEELTISCRHLVPAE